MKRFLRFLAAGGVFFLGASPLLRAGGQLNLFCWSEYVPAPVIDSFAKETGVHVSVENYASNEEMLAKLLAGGGSYDLVQPSEYTVEALSKAGLLLPVDRAAVPNFANLDPAFLNQPFDPGNRFSIPWMAGTVGIVINTERVHAPVRGFTDLFAGPYRGRIVALDDSRELVSWALATLHLPTNDITPATLARVRADPGPLVAADQSFRLRQPQNRAPGRRRRSRGGLERGGGHPLSRPPDKISMGAAGGRQPSIHRQPGDPEDLRPPARGRTIYELHPAPRVSRRISDAFPYTNPNLAARRLLSPAQLANPASYPPASGTAGLETFRDIGAMSSEVDALVSELKSAGR